MLWSAPMEKDAISYYLNWRAWPWRVTSKPMRALIFRPLRFFIRARRASLARAVLVVRNTSGDVLVHSNRLGEVRLPSLELNGWYPSAPQVEDWARQILGRDLKPVFAAIDGHCGDLRLIFMARASASAETHGEMRWLTPDDAAEHLLTTDLTSINAISHVGLATHRQRSRLSNK